ncbi:hypothetical protein KY290_033592 [Solanum tuberosum]|uniref:MULE transposase domain-containing protein n=1 Tax=Solanum tuberosum TaxID=4113 RepID=A0ABQ7U1T8_SOLTU|nr:hypothetical protein KY289_034724 [Solanum tuberosum]KAH0647604.1 hypothetical protein KY285_032852 [Solanum tuberosum]KAH0740549.1 hypothetical protein KY290_033592 [Solanum tuberosum]
MEDMNVDLLFHHGVKQVLVKGPFGNLFLVQDSDGIRILQDLLTEAFRCEYGTDAESESDDGLVDPTSDDDARKACNLYALATKKPLKVAKSDRKRLRYRCIEGCPFAILVSLDGKGPGYKLKTFKQEHNCQEALHNPRATTNTLSHYFKSKVQNNPKYALKDMKQHLMDNFNLNTKDSKLKRAKRMALQKMQCSFLDEYNRLEAYANEIRMTNPVDKETTTTWTWFLQLLEKSLNLKNGDSITFTSDMQKGLLNAVENVLPLSNHRYCVRHVEANWMKRFRTGEMKKLMWWAAWFL